MWSTALALEPMLTLMFSQNSWVPVDEVPSISIVYEPAGAAEGMAIVPWPVKDPTATGQGSEKYSASRTIHRFASEPGKM